MMSDCATHNWPAIRAHVRFYGSVSYKGDIPHYVGEWVDAGLLVEKTRKDGRITYVFGDKQ